MPSLPLPCPRHVRPCRASAARRRTPRGYSAPRRRRRQWWRRRLRPRTVSRSRRAHPCGVPSAAATVGTEGKRASGAPLPPSLADACLACGDRCGAQLRATAHARVFGPVVSLLKSLLRCAEMGKKAKAAISKDDFVKAMSEARHQGAGPPARPTQRSRPPRVAARACDSSLRRAHSHPAQVAEISAKKCVRAPPATHPDVPTCPLTDTSCHLRPTAPAASRRRRS